MAREDGEFIAPGESQILRVRSAEPETIRVPSREKATAFTPMS